MPKEPRTSARQTRQKKPLPPRRITEDEMCRKYRKERMKPAGPIDNWLCANSSAIDDSDGALSQNEVRCIVRVQVKPPVVDEDGWFEDPAVFELYLTLATPSIEGGAPVVQKPFVLGRWSGDNSSMDAPEWTRRRPGHDTVFRQPIGELTKLLTCEAARKTNLDPLIKSLKSVKLQ